jgi:hypothetical protein
VSRKEPDLVNSKCMGRRLDTVSSGRVALVQLVRFLVVKLTHPASNSRFDMIVVFTANYSFSGR